MLTWLGDDALILDDLAFRITFPHFETKTPIPEQYSECTLFVDKPRSMLETHIELFENLRPQRIVEIGIRYGGSTVFLATLANPERYVAIDLVDQTTPSFNLWLQSGPLHDRVTAYFGIDQADGSALRPLVDKEFGNDQLDLVIDDASHILGPTRASFETLFPRLRPGGVYVIEDWEAQHQWERALAKELNAGPEARARVEKELSKRAESWERLKQPLTHLIFEVVVASAYSGIVDDIRIQPGFVTIRRGNQHFDEEGFALSNFYLDLGRDLLRFEPGSTN